MARCNISARAATIAVLVASAGACGRVGYDPSAASSDGGERSGPDASGTADDASLSDAAVLDAATTPALATLFWSDDMRGLHRSKVDGTDVQLVLDVPADGLAVDSASGHVYWTQWAAGELSRADLQGQRAEVLIAGVETPDGIALDFVNRKLYWCEYEAGRIMRANLDGSNAEQVASGRFGPTSIAVDPGAGFLYWIDEEAEVLVRADLDGGGIQTLVAAIVGGNGLNVEPVGGHLYWTANGTADAAIQRSNLDGSGLEVFSLMDPMADPEGLALDVSGGRMYWSRIDDGSIWRAALDGTNPERLVSGLGQPRALRLAP